MNEDASASFVKPARRFTVGRTWDVEPIRYNDLIMSQDFLRSLDDTNRPLTADLDINSDRLLIFFGGVQGFTAIPPFEFLNLTRDIPAKKIFVRDLEQSWYQMGLRGIASDVDGLTAYFRDVIRSQSVRRVVTVGNSMGGYASLLFGALLNVDAVLAFSPRTYLSFGKSLLTLDFRWRRQVAKARRANKNPIYLDLRRVMQTTVRKGTYHLHYSADDFRDTLHALNMRGTGVDLVRHPQGGHVLVKHLRDSGELKRALEKALG